MALPQDFWEQLPHKTDAELYDILNHQDDYLPEALAVAKAELSKRNLTPESVAQIKSAAENQKSAAESKAQERLGWPMRIFLFVFFAGIFGSLLGVYYENKGYKRKALDCWITMGLSLAFHLVVWAFLWLS